jgi:hypothetical protein
MRVAEGQQAALRVNDMADVYIALIWCSQANSIHMLFARAQMQRQYTRQTLIRI